MKLILNAHFSKSRSSRTPISVVKSFWNVARSNSVQDFNTIWQLSNKLCREIWVWDAFPNYILCCNTQPPQHRHWQKCILQKRQRTILFKNKFIDWFASAPTNFTWQIKLYKCKTYHQIVIVSNMTSDLHISEISVFTHHHIPYHTTPHHVMSHHVHQTLSKSLYAFILRHALR